jgi:hypothetical protein
MDADAEFRKKESELAALREEAIRIVAAESSQGRALTNQEDSHVLAVMSRVRALEEGVHRGVKRRSTG